MTIRKLFPSALLATVLMTSPLLAQEDGSDADRRAEAVQRAEQIDALMTDLEARAASFPEVLEALRQGRANIEQADETVAQLIARLTEVTDAMEDDSEFDNAIDGYREETQSLIDQAEASDNDAIRGVIPTLRDTLRSLDSDDRSRAETVIEARNVIAALEENREAIAFFIRAGEVTRAAELISTNVAEFGDIVARGRAVATGIISAATP
ncbi:hypothetical protein [Tropicibacter alexandrii]|uniref:hypothetical protein n=1 Tax=Tropicibacter alexandrii TaxID=2267683 RepID=UPI000EF52A5B|nr:hypothetical protein [Tropicibacter alexandrii]